ncbi:MAG: hypothetical protein ACR652_26085 [Methylocystis sp.]|uniref:hypothetical protein n=1 Tax=Methylocystis sp. TaxID=1911079 RepID=UPI003DA60438
MTLTAKQQNELKKIIKIASELLEQAEKGNGRGNGAKRGATQRTRRSGAELASFRKQLKNDRKAGVPVAEIAKKYGVSVSYIYQL